MCKSLKLYGNEVFAVSAEQQYSLAGLLRLSAEVGRSRKKLHKNSALPGKEVLTKPSLVSEVPENGRKHQQSPNTVYQNE